MLFRPWNTCLYFHINTFRSRCAAPNMAVVCNSLILCFPDMLFTYCLSDFQMIPVAPIITGITFAFTFFMRRIYILRSLCFKIFSASFLITLLSPGIIFFFFFLFLLLLLLCSSSSSSSSSSSYYYYYIVVVVSCHRPFLPGTSLEPTVIPSAQASIFRLQYFPY